MLEFASLLSGTRPPFVCVREKRSLDYDEEEGIREARVSSTTIMREEGQCWVKSRIQAFFLKAEGGKEILDCI